MTETCHLCRKRTTADQHLLVNERETGWIHYSCWRQLAAGVRAHTSSRGAIAYRKKTIDKNKVK